MDAERKKRNRIIRLVITEIFMVIMIIALVIVATFALTGWRVGKDLGREQSALVHIATIPSGATVEIDGATISSHTEVNRMLPGGEHTIKLTKDGFDSWEKTVSVEPGWLLRLRYPRLFRQDRTPELIQKTNPLFLHYSPDRTALLYAESKTTWRLLSIRGDRLPEPKAINVEAFISADTTIDQITWGDNNKLLVKTHSADKISWFVINLEDVKRSVNLTSEYGLNFTELKLVNNSADRLVGVENGNLREVNLSSSVSKVLLSNIKSFDLDGTNLSYVATTSTGKHLIGTYKLGEESGVTVSEFTTSSLASVLTTYYGEKYLATIVDDNFTVYKAENLPSSKETFKMQEIFTEKLSFTSNSVSVNISGQFITIKNGANLAIFYTELSLLHQYVAPSNQSWWLDDSMLTTVKDGKLFVWDFDGTNRRELISSAAKSAPAVVSANNHYLYYLSETGLTRERVD